VGMHISYLRTLAFAFRQSIEKVVRSQAPELLHDFPKGCCSWASYFIGHYLKYELDLEPKRFVGALHAPSGNHHEWIVLDDTIIDITADQFDDMSEPVVVSAESQWHSQLTGGCLTDVKPVSEYDSVIWKDGLKPSDVYEMVVKPIRKEH